MQGNDIDPRSRPVRGTTRPRTSTIADTVPAPPGGLVCMDCNLALGRHLHRHLAAAPAEARRARREVAAALSSWGCPPSVVDDAVLLVSELVSNAVRYGTEVSVTVDLVHVGDRLLLEVTDGSRARPRVRRPEPDDEQGRGMQLVQALATAWGSRHDDRQGKTTWCTLALDCRDAPPDRG